MNIDQEKHMLMVDDNVRNQFRQNAVQNVGHLVRLTAVQNQGIQNVGNQNGLSIDPRIANQYGTGNVVTTRAEGNGNGINGNPIRCYNCQGVDHYARNYTVKPRKTDTAYLQTQLQIAQKKKHGSNSILRKLISWLLLTMLPSMIQMDQLRIQFLKEAAKFVRDFKSLAKEADESFTKHKALELEIERLLRAVVSQNIMSIVLSNSVIAINLRKTTFFFWTKLYVVTPLPKSKSISMVGESNALSKHVTSNSVPSSHESTVVNNERVIAPGIFRINPFKASRVDNFVPNKQ
nr:hypothetical protein [Tanacetum cinerariifolium]